jgi:hypothetical protein
MAARTLLPANFLRGAKARSVLTPRAPRAPLAQLHSRAADGPDEWRFPRPSFKVVILYVDEEESVRRQLRRAQLASLHNKRVMDAGSGDVWNVRTTDVSEALCRRRYQVRRL